MSSTGFILRPNDKQFSQLQAVCEKCGAVLIGSILDGLEELMQDHAEKCDETPLKRWLT